MRHHTPYDAGIHAPAASPVSNDEVLHPEVVESPSPVALDEIPLVRLARKFLLRLRRVLEVSRRAPAAGRLVPVNLLAFLHNLVRVRRLRRNRTIGNLADRRIQRFPVPQDHVLSNDVRLLRVERPIPMISVCSTSVSSIVSANVKFHVLRFQPVLVPCNDLHLLRIPRPSPSAPDAIGSEANGWCCGLMPQPAAIHSLCRDGCGMRMDILLHYVVPTA